VIPYLVMVSTSIAVNVKKASARANILLKEVVLKQSHLIPFNESLLYPVFSLTYHVIATLSIKHP